MTTPMQDFETLPDHLKMLALAEAINVLFYWYRSTDPIAREKLRDADPLREAVITVSARPLL